MAMNIGQAQADPVTGLSGEIWTQLKTEITQLAPLTTTQTASARKLCESIALAVINHIKANAVVSGASIT